jgi:hypothetical protein
VVVGSVSIPHSTFDLMKEGCQILSIQALTFIGLKYLLNIKQQITFPPIKDSLGSSLKL